MGRTTDRTTGQHPESSAISAPSLAWLGWAGAGLGWAGSGLGWAAAGLGWAGLGWAGLCLVTWANWLRLTEIGRVGAGLGWAGLDWAVSGYMGKLAEANRDR